MSSLFKGLLTGAAIGGIAGLFFAPRSGKETRQRIINEIEDTIGSAVEFTKDVSQVKADFHDLTQKKEELLDPFIHDIKQTLTDFKFQSDPRMEAIKKQIEKTKKDSETLKN